MTTRPCKLKILMIEDDEDDYLLARDHLNHAYAGEYRLEWFQHTEQGLAALQNSQYDIILLDCFIGQNNGIEFAKFIQQHTTNIAPIVLLTGQEETENATRALTAGIEDYLIKSQLTATLLKQTIHYAITRQQVKLALKQSEARLRTILDTMADGVITLDDGGHIHTFNPAAEKLFGYTSTEVIQNPITGLIPLLSELEPLSECYGTDNPETVSLHKNGHDFPVELSISGFKMNNKKYFTCIVRDISERKRAEAKIEHQAYYDPLTELPNRRLLMEKLTHALQYAYRHQQFGALLFLDLDRFKNLNDSLGHATGDALLKQVAARISHNIRDIDTVARLGGDEFVILLSQIDEDEQMAINQAYHISEKLRSILAEPYTINDTEYCFAASIGVSLFPQNDFDTAEDILKFADAAMYNAKSNGRNRVRFYDPDIQAAADARLELETELRNSITSSELELYYQPYIHAKGHTIGCEVLLRWNHPQKGLLLPDGFITTAEESDLIIDIGDWVIRNSLLHYQKMSFKERNFFLSINISPTQFRQANFVQKVRSMLQPVDFKREHIIFEITENMLIENTEDTIAKILALKQLGIMTSIDDFGTGYSSLAYLKRLPIGQIKIDKSFIIDMALDPSNLVIIEAVISMASHFNIDVIAEGVEDKSTLDLLIAKGCKYFQGFYFSPAIQAEEFKRRLPRISEEGIGSNNATATQDEVPQAKTAAAKK